MTADVAPAQHREVRRLTVELTTHARHSQPARTVCSTDEAARATSDRSASRWLPFAFIVEYSVPAAAEFWLAARRRGPR